MNGLVVVAVVAIVALVAIVSLGLNRNLKIRSSGKDFDVTTGEQKE